MTTVARGVVLDLDDTLYLERDYVRSGFRAVANHLADRLGVDPDEAEKHLWARFTSGERGRHFDDLIARDPALHGFVETDELVEVYRNHEPTIAFLPGISDLLDALRAAGRPTALISDGALAGQEAKVRALGLDTLIDGPLVLTDRWGRDHWKPHPRAFEHVQQALGLPPDHLVYVGDNPHKDFDSPRALGWSCIRLRRTGQLHVDVPDRIVPDAVVGSVTALAEALTCSA